MYKHRLYVYCTVTFHVVGDYGVTPASYFSKITTWQQHFAKCDVTRASRTSQTVMTRHDGWHFQLSSTRTRVRRSGRLGPSHLWEIKWLCKFSHTHFSIQIQFSSLWVKSLIVFLVLGHEMTPKRYTNRSFLCLYRLLEPSGAHTPVRPHPS